MVKGIKKETAHYCNNWWITKKAGKTWVCPKCGSVYTCKLVKGRLTWLQTKDGRKL